MPDGEHSSLVGNVLQNVHVPKNNVSKHNVPKSDEGDEEGEDDGEEGVVDGDDGRVMKRPKYEKRDKSKGVGVEGEEGEEEEEEKEGEDREFQHVAGFTTHPRQEELGRRVPPRLSRQGARGWIL